MYQNLVDKTYLHSSKWTFFKNSADLVSTILPNEDYPARLQQSINKLQTLAEQAKQNEQQFYQEFEVGSAAEWSKKFLLADANNRELTIQQRIMKAFKSPKVIELLTSANNYDVIDNFLLDFQQYMGQEEVIRLKEAIDVAAPSNLSDYIALAFDMNSKTKRGNVQLEQQFLTAVSQQYNSKKIKVNKRAVTERFFKPYERILNQNNKRVDELTINQVIDYIREEVGTNISDSDKQQMEEILVKLKQSMLKDLDKIHRITSTNVQVVLGEILDMGNPVIYDEFTWIDNAGNKQIMKVVDAAIAKVPSIAAKGNSETYSKVDNIWQARENGRKWHIQNKNSEDSIYDTVYDLDALNQLSSGSSADRAGHFKLQGKISAKTLLDNLLESGELNDEDIKALSYLMVNATVLGSSSMSEDERLYRGVTKKDNHVYAEKTMHAIDGILAKGIAYFFGDYIVENGEIRTHMNDFFILNNQILVPVSQIYTNLINMIKDFNKTMMDVKISTGLKGTVDTDTIRQRKKDIINEDPDKTPDYHNENLVKFGTEEGQNVFNNQLQVTSVIAHYDIKNLVSYGLG